MEEIAQLGRRFGVGTAMVGTGWKRNNKNVNQVASSTPRVRRPAYMRRKSPYGDAKNVYPGKTLLVFPVGD